MQPNTHKVLIIR